MPRDNYNPEKHGVSYSMLADWLECREKTRFRIAGISPKKPALPLMFGGLGHDVLSLVHGNVAEGKLTKIPDAKYIGKLLKQVEKEFIKSNQLDAKGLELLELCLGFHSVLLPEYFEHYGDELFKKEWHEFDNKFFRCDIKISGSTTIPIIGVKDAAYTVRGVNKKTKKKVSRLWLMEHKFLSVINQDNMVDTLGMSMQNGMYLIALEDEMKKRPKGVCYNVIRRPGLYRRKDEALPEFVERIRLDIRKRPEWYFIRLQIPNSKSEMANTLRDLQGILVEFVAWYKGKRMHFRSTNACQNKYGLCTFNPICARDDYSMFKGGRLPDHFRVNAPE